MSSPFSGACPLILTPISARSLSGGFPFSFNRFRPVPSFTTPLIRQRPFTFFTPLPAPFFSSLTQFLYRPSERPSEVYEIQSPLLVPPFTLSGCPPRAQCLNFECSPVPQPGFFFKQCFCFSTPLFAPPSPQRLVDFVDEI